MLPIAFLFAAASASDYAGSAACRGCHAAQYAAQSSTAHARALARSKPGQPGEWAFGAGSQAITFVSRADTGSYLELDQTWFTALNRYARTPGHLQAGGKRYRIFDPEAAILRCFACHSTGPPELDDEGAIVPREAGVRCEDCHGPSAVHASAPGSARPLNPGHLDGAAMNQLCGACHRTPAAAPDLHDPWNARHQPLLLAASRCFRESQGRLTCIVCHAPHQPLETRIAAYNAVCAGCHRAPRHSTPVGAAPCAGCHMPAVKPAEGLSFANHRIAIYKPGEPLSPLMRTGSAR